MIILGGGSALDECVTLSKSLDLQKDIVFTGHVDNPIPYISNSSLFVLPSFYEGLSNQLLEAIFCGVPIIATDCPGNRFTVEYTNNSKTDILFLPAMKSNKDKHKWARSLNKINSSNSICNPIPDK